MKAEYAGGMFVVDNSKPFQLQKVNGTLAPFYDLEVTRRNYGKSASGKLWLGLGVPVGLLLVFMPLIVDTPVGGAGVSWTLGGLVLSSALIGGPLLIHRGRAQVEVHPRQSLSD